MPQFCGSVAATWTGSVRRISSVKTKVDGNVGKAMISPSELRSDLIVLSVLWLVSSALS